jgi:hypothetical protein
VELDRLFRHPQLLADRLVREATRECGEDRGLALGEAGRARRALAGVGQADGAVDGSVDGLAKRRRQIDRIDALDDEGARAALEDGLDHVLVGRDREDDDLHLGVLLADAAQAREPVGARHAQVEQDEVGTRATDHRQHLRAGVALADDLEVRRLFQRALDSFYDQAVIVGDEDSHARIVVRESVVLAGAIS